MMGPPSKASEASCTPMPALADRVQPAMPPGSATVPDVFTQRPPLLADAAITGVLLSAPSPCPDT